MKIQDRYPIIVTDRLDDCVEFWTSRLGLTVTFSSTWFQLLSREDGEAILAFMSPDHPSAPPGPEPFGGLGMCFEVEVEDATAALKRYGHPPDYPLTDEPFGQRRFGFRDPSGLWVDVVEQIEPEAGWWDRYLI